MLTKVKKDGVTYRIGDRLRAVKASSDIGMCPPGVTVEVVAIIERKEESGGLTLGVKSTEKELDGWHDLDGMVSHGQGLWVTIGTVRQCFEKIPNVYKVIKDFTYRRRNLKGMKFRLLSDSADGGLIAEMEENVGGCGGDGLGKAGHCVLLPGHVVTTVKKK